MQAICFWDMDIFSLQIQTIRAMLDWRVSLDIFFLTILIFFLYQNLRTAGTWKIVLGIMFAAAIFAAARFLNLKGIEWIYSNLSQILLLALVIIFQPELRRIFERMASLQRRDIGSAASQLAFIISDAAFSLAQQHRGALIVLPGKDSVKAWTSEGIQLDAKLSFPLLMSIFDPHSPGHDGAVIIENGRATAFSVKLPLSKSSVLSEEYGTRHHAGLGLSEVTDAFVITVSEERGTVTVFSQGAVEKIASKNILSAQISNHWKNTAAHFLISPTEPRKRILIARLAISFLLAFFFWSTVVLSQSTLKRVFFTIPIDYSGLPKNLVLNNEKMTDIRIGLIGSSVDLNNVHAQQIRVHVDLSKLMPGRNIVHLSEKNVDLPPGVKLISIVPATLEFDLMQITETDANVIAQIIGNFPRSVALDTIRISPQRIRVMVPVDEASDTPVVLQTTPIYAESIRENMVIRCHVVAPPQIRPANGGWPIIEVHILLKQSEQGR
ncbi:MAG: diadenylate cyclase [candidate division KSB1 bacterium]|nr:diadenylate cyclase [candidate division KSB1 bacterium]MDZ7318580.1 diadenylate cyclase [candidate division KSB1 bacterium]MDZ7339716.1 diadenylate cyclase [candidate division KSB1 bacterium]